VELVISEDNIAIDLEGEGVAKIADLIKPLIKKMISTTLTQQVKTLLPTVIDTDLNADLAITQERFGKAPLSLDFSHIKAPEVSAKGYIAANYNATFFDPEVSTSIPFTPVALPDRLDAGKDLQFFFSDYSINTLLFARFQAKEQVDLTSYLSLAGITLTTDSLAVAIPELVTKYGKGVPVEVQVQLTKDVPQFKFSSSGASLTGSNTITIIVNGEKAIVAENDGVSIIGHVSSDAGKIHGKIESWSLGTITIQSTTLTSANLVKEVTDFATTTVAQVNAALAEGLALPVFPGIDYTDAEIKNLEGYMHFGISVAKSAATKLSIE
jgi:hypothetical protein